MTTVPNDNLLKKSKHYLPFVRTERKLIKDYSKYPLKKLQLVAPNPLEQDNVPLKWKGSHKGGFFKISKGRHLSEWNLYTYVWFRKYTFILILQIHVSSPIISISYRSRHCSIHQVTEFREDHPSLKKMVGDLHNQMHRSECLSR